MPEWLAWPANLLGVTFVIITTILFLFPPAIVPAVTGSTMNYCVVAFAIVLLISMIQWFIDGRKNYTGPKIDIDMSMLTAEQSAELREQLGETNSGSEPEDKDKVV